MTIKELRTARMMSQSQFAEKIGIDRSDLGKYENGKKKVTAALMLKIKDASVFRKDSPAQVSSDIDNSNKKRYITWVSCGWVSPCQRLVK